MNYKYVGDGAGVPGLPHEISDEEAEALGVTELLMAALENGSYVKIEQSADLLSQSSDQPSASGQLSGKSEKKAKRPPVVLEEEKTWLDEPAEGKE